LKIGSTAYDGFILSDPIINGKNMNSMGISLSNGTNNSKDYKYSQRFPSFFDPKSSQIKIGVVYDNYQRIPGVLTNANSLTIDFKKGIIAQR
jgi:hypothetical protein